MTTKESLRRYFSCMGARVLVQHFRAPQLVKIRVNVRRSRSCVVQIPPTPKLHF